MSTERPLEQHHRPRRTAQKVEHVIGVLMVIAIAILAVGLVYGLLQTGSTPSYLK